MTKSRREKYYNRCQEIIDDLHERVARGEFLDETHCINRYGKADYQALLHELHLMGADQNWKTMTPAMEWLYSSQYFTNKAEEEKRQAKLFRYALYSAMASIISAFVALVAIFLGPA